MAKKGRQQGVKNTELSQKQKYAVDLYTNRDRKETFGNQTKAYMAAGYEPGTEKTASAAATRLFAQTKVIQYMKQLEDDRKALVVKSQEIVEITAEKARNDLLDTLELCKSKGDITNLVACVRLELQITGQLSEKIVFNIEDSRKLNESHRKQAQRIASIISEQRMLGTQAAQLSACSRPIDAQFTEQSDTDNGLTASESSDDNISGDNDL